MHLCLTNCYNNKNWHNMFVCRAIIVENYFWNMKNLWNKDLKKIKKQYPKLDWWFSGCFTMCMCVCLCVCVCVCVCVHVYMRACVHLLVYAYVWNLRERDKCVVCGHVSAHTWQWKHMLDVHKVWCNNFFQLTLLKTKLAPTTCTH